MENVVCDLCGNDQPIPYLQQTDRFGDEVFSLCRCAQCGLIYLNPRPTPEEIKKYYPEDYEAFYDLGAASPMRQWHLLRSLNAQLDFVEAHIPSRGRLLDVGCATGNFLHVAQTRGWEVAGIEINPRAAEFANQRYGVQVFTEPLEHTAALLPDNSFDVITLWDVLEHLPSPRTAMQHIHRLLAPSGVVVFSIPNLRSFDRYIFGSTWIGWDTPRHFTLFGPQTLNTLLELTGFAATDAQCVTGGKGTFFLSVDSALRRHQHLSWLKKGYPLLGALLWPYRQLSYRLQRGTIITYAAKKLSAE